MALVLVDTDVCIDHLRRRTRLRPRSDVLHCSVVTLAELFVGGGEAEIRRLLSTLKQLPMTSAIAERAGRLRRRIDIDLPDAVIAATALEHGLVLLTRKVADFRDVPRLRIRQPA